MLKYLQLQLTRNDIKSDGMCTHCYQTAVALPQSHADRGNTGHLYHVKSMCCIHVLTASRQLLQNVSVIDAQSSAAVAACVCLHGHCLFEILPEPCRTTVGHVAGRTTWSQRVSLYDLRLIPEHGFLFPIICRLVSRLATNRSDD